MMRLPAVRKRASAAYVALASSFWWAVRVLWVPHQRKRTRTAAVSWRRRSAGLTAVRGRSGTVRVLIQQSPWFSEGWKGKEGQGGRKLARPDPEDPIQEG